MWSRCPSTVCVAMWESEVEASKNVVQKYKPNQCVLDERPDEGNASDDTAHGVLIERGARLGVNSTAHLL